MATTTRLHTQAERNVELIPKLQNVDHLTREEFEHRYEAEKTLTKAELIDGVVHIPLWDRPGRLGWLRSRFVGWLGHYYSETPGVEGAINGSIRLDTTSETQPDLMLLISSGFGGQAHIDEDDFVAGAPELIADIATIEVTYDLVVKLNAYWRSGVREFVIWRAEGDAIDWFVRRGDNFERLPVGGIYKSEVFPGLWLDATAMIAGDLGKVLQVLKQGLATPEHAAFVQHLQQKRDQLAKKIEKEP